MTSVPLRILCLLRKNEDSDDEITEVRSQDVQVASGSSGGNPNRVVLNAKIDGTGSASIQIPLTIVINLQTTNGERAEESKLS